MCSYHSFPLQCSCTFPRDYRSSRSFIEAGHPPPSNSFLHPKQHFPIANQTFPSETILRKDRHPINIHHRSHFKLDSNSPHASTTHFLLLDTTLSSSNSISQALLTTLPQWPSLQNHQRLSRQGCSYRPQNPSSAPNCSKGLPIKHCTYDGITPSSYPEPRLSMLSIHVEVPRFRPCPYLAAIQLRP